MTPCIAYVAVDWPVSDHNIESFAYWLVKDRVCGGLVKGLREVRKEKRKGGKERGNRREGREKEMKRKGKDVRIEQKWKGKGRCTRKRKGKGG